jgi:TolA-binding protein
VARISRKELKADKFALEVEHTVTFFEEHRKDLLRYGAVALAVVAVLLGYSVYRRHARTERQDALTQAIAVQEAAIASASTTGSQVFPTQEAKDQAATKAFSGIVSKYSGSDESNIAQYYMGAILADQGKMAEAEKLFLEVADKGDATYGSLAKFSLSQIYYATGRLDQAEKILRELISNPSIFVSKDEATLTLARCLMGKKPAEARTLLDPLRTKGGPVSEMAMSLYGQLATP